MFTLLWNKRENLIQNLLPTAAATAPRRRYPPNFLPACAACDFEKQLIPNLRDRLTFLSHQLLELCMGTSIKYEKAILIGILLQGFIFYFLMFCIQLLYNKHEVCT